MVLLRRPIIIALLIGAGITSTVVYRRSTAVDASPDLAATVHGGLDPGMMRFAAMHGPVMQAGLFQMPLLSLSDMRSVPARAMGTGSRGSLATPASLVLTPSGDDDIAPREDLEPAGQPIHDGMKAGV